MLESTPAAAAWVLAEQRGWRKMDDTDCIVDRDRSVPLSGGKVAVVHPARIAYVRCIRRPKMVCSSVSHTRHIDERGALE